MFEGHWFHDRQVVDDFYRAYTADFIVDWMKNLLDENQDFRNKFIDWQKKHIPPSWEQDIANEEDRAHDWIASLYDEKSKIDRKAVIHSLCIMGVLKYD